MGRFYGAFRYIDAGAPAVSGANGERKAEIAGRLEAVRARIAAACDAAGRVSDEVTLIAVTKTYPVSDIELLCELGACDIGENRDQEAAPKAAECAALGVPVTWHFVGQLQTNKAASVVSYASVVHSVDRLRLVGALGARARQAGRRVTCLAQVSLDGDPDRGGAFGPQVMAVADAIAAEAGLALGGVMAVAPLDADAGEAFRQLAKVADTIRSAHPGAVMISAGMSADLEQAIEAGATHVRVGTALLGGRRAFVR
jgi:PLP dependent protein